MQTIEFTYHLKDIDRIAVKVLEHLSSKTLLLYGEMGSGKTTFVNALLKALCSEDTATSPTFSIVNEYHLPKHEKMYHFDLYRLEQMEDIFNLGYEDYLNSGEWLCIEWPERLKHLTHEDAQTLVITIKDDTTRSLKLTLKTQSLTENNAMTAPKF